jgi:type IV pilus assembly protein PilY1
MYHRGESGKDGANLTGRIMMMCKRSVIIYHLLIICSALVFWNSSWAMDTDLYTVTGQEVPPNVLIVLDNSSSMTNEDQGFDYNPNTPALPPDYEGTYEKGYVYNDSDGKGTWVVYSSSVNGILCNVAQNSLRPDGMYNGKLNSDSSCVTGKKGGVNVTLRTGNYLNWQILSSTSRQPRLGLAKGILHSYINSTDGIRFGIMVFNANGQGGKVTAECSDDKHGAFTALSDISTSKVVDWTPLAETLYESMLYFKGGSSYYNPGTSYNSPTLYRCAKNYVILITDGAPSHDVSDDLTSPIVTSRGGFPVIGDYDHDGKDSGTYGDSLLLGSHYLDDVAKYAHNNDLRSDLSGQQNMTVYTIGFNSNQLAIDSSLLQSTAANGGGKYFYCHNSNTFDAALQYIIAEILAKSTSFVAPTVPISQLEKTTSENRMYLGMFKPSETSFWKGNIKKFGIASQNTGTIKIGDVLDANGHSAIDPETNSILDTAVSYWATAEDGGEVEKGGVGEILQGMSNLYDRKIYTYSGTSSNLTDSTNLFTTTNANITPSWLGLSTADERNKLISFLYGYDAYDANGNGNTTEKRDWVLGAFVHSRPLVLHYNSRSVIYAGANDGMLHAFDEDSGQELWAFIPQDLRLKLKDLIGNTVQFFVDGSPKAYIGSDGQKIIICGERRGGNHYFALDVTDPLAPKWLWEIHPGLSDYAEMGQSWSSPMISKIPGDRWVIFIGGGYDPNQDTVPVSRADTMGRAIYVVDVKTGVRIWKYSVADNAEMKYSIPSDIARVDTNGDGYIDRLYAGDTGGQMWRFDIVSDNGNLTWSGKRIFDANVPAPSAGVDRRKIFYPPDVSLEKDASVNYELVLFGTGDREHPKSTTVVDRLYTLKDKNPSTVLTESALVDVTDDLLQNSSTSSTEKQTIMNNLKAASGWYIRLNQYNGEKCLAPPLVMYGVSYFSTFAPLQEDVSDPCFLGEGTARLYGLNYLNGNAIFNFNLTNDNGDITVLGKNDRSMIVGTAIPSGAVIAVIGGNTTAGYIGVGGGIFKAPLKSSNVIIPLTWRQKF